ncbi:MAG TPA: FMN-binding negative transcriptional regulator [Caulobacteraceae bacterium]|jgi:transcriptional regulator
MYAPEPFAVIDPDEIDRLLSAARLGALVTHGAEGFWASHLPFLHEAGEGRLIGHLARPNPQHRLSPAGAEALVIFTGVDAYVSPNWYPSKAVHGKQVPTWNYEAVHVHGRLSWFDGPERLLDVVAKLSDRFETGRPAPWSVSDAPETYIRSMLRGIVGVEVTVERVFAKRKLSQNKDSEDFAGVLAGLEAAEDAGAAETAAAMRALAPRG